MFLDLPRVNVQPARYHHVLLAVNYVKVAVLVAAGQVAGGEPAVAHYRCGLGGLAVEPIQQIWRARIELAYLAGRHLEAFIIEQAHFVERKGPPDTLLAQQLVRGAQVGDHSGLGRSVGLVQQPSAPVLDYSLLGRLRQRRCVRHDRPQSRESAAPAVEHRRFLAEDGMEVRRHHEYAGEGVGAELPQHQFRIEFWQHVDRPAEIERRHDEGEACAVCHRRNPELQVVRTVAAILHRHSVEGQGTRTVRNDDSLWLAGSAGAVDEREGVGLANRLERQDRRRAGDPGLVLVAEDDAALDAGEARCRHRFGRLRVGNDHPCATVVAGLGNLPRRQPRAQRRDHCTGIRQAAYEFRILDAVGRHDRDTVAGPQPRSDGRARYASHALGQFTVAAGHTLAKQCRLAWGAVGGGVQATGQQQRAVGGVG